MLCPQCDSEYLDGITTCATCRVALVTPADHQKSKEALEDQKNCEGLVPIGDCPLDYETEAIVFSLGEQGVLGYVSQERKVFVPPDQKEKALQVLDVLLLQEKEMAALIDPKILQEDEGHAPANLPEESGDKEKIDLVTIGTCDSDMEAGLLKSYFSSQGVFCYIQGENHHQLLGILGSYIQMRVMVSSADQELATRLFRSYKNSQQNAAFATTGFTETKPVQHKKIRTAFFLALVLFYLAWALFMPGP